MPLDLFWMLVHLPCVSNKFTNKNTLHNGISPPNIVVEIVGTEAGDQGRSCEEHPVNCGEVLDPDVVVRLWKVQLMVEGRGEETAIAAVWVTDGMDCCRVGFLPCHMVKHASVAVEDEEGRCLQEPSRHTASRPGQPTPA